MSKVTDAAKNLPSDPEFALLTFAEKIKQLHGAYGTLDDEDAIFAARFVRHFSKRFPVDIKIEYPTGGSLSAQAINVVDQIIREKKNLLAKKVDVDIENLLADYSVAQGDTFGLAHLNSDEKKKILDGIERIRKIIEASDLPDRKRNALYERMADLIREVNTHGTRTDRFFSFAGDMAFVLGDMTTKAKPLLTEVKEILKIVSRSRARQEGISLPPGDEVLQLPVPTADEEA